MSPALWAIPKRARHAAVRLYRRHHTRAETRDWLRTAVAGAAKVLYAAEAIGEARQDALDAYRSATPPHEGESERAYVARLEALLRETRARLGP